MAKESVFTLEEKESIEIVKFIFHIIIEDQLKPIFLDELELDDAQKKFFKKRFEDASEGTQYLFIDKKKSIVNKNCVEILKDVSKNFILKSEDLTADFKRHHNKTTNNGVFITAIIRIEGNVDLIFLMKLEHRKVYGYERKDKKAIMKEIQNTFVEDKRAIQKVAIVDVNDNFKWNVLAFDRNATGKKGLSDYFANYLEVIERETPSVLTQRTLSTVIQWAKQNKSFLNPDFEIAVYKQRAIDYLIKARRVNSKDLITAIVADTDMSRQKKLRKTLSHSFDEAGLTGQVYPPNIGSLKAAVKKNIRKTAEGIKIEWEGSPEEVNIEIPSMVNSNDGLYHISIKTSKIDVIS
jgi:hypothetical protein